MSRIRFENQTTPATPPAGKVTAFVDSADKKTKQIDDAGLVTDLTAGGGGGAVWSVVVETTASRTAAAGEFILVNVATCVITLPAPVLDDRVAVKVITATPTSIEVRTSGAGIDIDGTDYSASGLVLADQFEQINLTSDGTDWFIY